MYESSAPTHEVWPEEGAGPLPARLPPAKENVVKRVFATIGFIADATRRRRTGRRALWLVVLLLATSGVAMLLYPFYTHYYANRQQGQLEQQFDAIQTEQQIDAYKKKQIAVGGALTQILIPRLKGEKIGTQGIIVVEGVTGNALRAGAGHYPETALPGDFGNVAIAGHRTGFGQPFRNIHKLRPGDTIILVTPIGTYTYEVTPPFDEHPNPWVTHPTDFSVIQPTAEPSLTLTTCDPPHTSLNRLIVRAKLIKTELKVRA